MGTLLKATLIILGAGCTLLVAGAFPLMGAPAVYKGGAMLLIGFLAAVLALLGGWRLAKGQRLRFLAGGACTFFTLTGLATLWEFIPQTLNYARLGGAMWFGAIGMGSLALVGFLFTIIFGYFALRLMNRHLWLAGAHWSLVLLFLGAFTDYLAETACTLHLPADGKSSVSEVRSSDGQTHSLGFTLQANRFSIERHHTGAPTFTLYQWEGNHWEPLANLKPEGGVLSHKQESWPVDSFRPSAAPGLQPYLLLPGEPMRLLMQNPSPIRQYNAECLLTVPHRGQQEKRAVTLRVNEPISCEGWQIYLMGYQPMGNTALLQLEARHAPGRLPFALPGMIGIIICTAGWCWWKKDTSHPEPCPA